MRERSTYERGAVFHVGELVHVDSVPGGVCVVAVGCARRLIDPDAETFGTSGDGNETGAEGDGEEDALAVGDFETPEDVDGHAEDDDVLDDVDAVIDEVEFGLGLTSLAVVEG